MKQNSVKIDLLFLIKLASELLVLQKVRKKEVTLLQSIQIIVIPIFFNVVH